MSLKTEIFQSHKFDLKIMASFTKSEQIIPVRITRFD
jgi:hypothetical protein